VGNRYVKQLGLCLCYIFVCQTARLVFVASVHLCLRRGYYLSYENFGMVGSLVHSLELVSSFHVPGICIVPWGYGSRSLIVAEVGDFLVSRTRRLLGAVGQRLALT
jgi:hypothetical protein